MIRLFEALVDHFQFGDLLLCKAIWEGFPIVRSFMENGDTRMVGKDVGRLVFEQLSGL